MSRSPRFYCLDIETRFSFSPTTGLHTCSTIVLPFLPLLMFSYALSLIIRLELRFRSIVIAKEPTYEIILTDGTGGVDGAATSPASRTGQTRRRRN